MRKILIAGISCALFACNSGTDKTTTTTDSIRQGHDTMAGVVHDTANPTTTMPADSISSNFVMKAADGGMMEVELGRIAAQKAKSQRVKDFGNMMVTDHSKANDELKSIASGKHITVPATMSAMHQKEVDILGKKSGADFDNAYMSMMVNDHIKDVDEFKKASTDLKDGEIKAFASRTLPVLQKHLDSAKAIKK